MSEEKGPLDRLFDKLDSVVDSLKPDPPPRREASSPDVVDVEFTEIHDAPTQPDHTFVIARVMPSGHHHIFVHMNTEAVCGSIFDASQIQGRKLIDPNAEHKSIICVGCVGRALIMASKFSQKRLGP